MLDGAKDLLQGLPLGIEVVKVQGPDLIAGWTRGGNALSRAHQRDGMASIRWDETEFSAPSTKIEQIIYPLKQL